MTMQLVELENQASVLVGTRGHVDKSEFIDAYMEMFGLDVPDRPTYDEVRHVYVNETYPDGYNFWWSETTESDDTGIPVTWLC